MNMQSTSLAPAEQSGGTINPARHLTLAELREAKKIAHALDVRDSMALTSFGLKAQREISGVADPILRMVATKDTGAAGEALADLMREMREVDADSFAAEVESFLAKVPVVGRLFSGLERFRARYERIGSKVDRVVVRLDRSKYVLSRDVALLDKFYEENLTYLRTLLVYIIAGEFKLEDLREGLTRLQAEAAASGDPLEAQRAADLGNAIARLERRVHDLKLATVVALQTAPQIRLVQNGNQMLIEKIQSSVDITIPLWKGQIIQALALINQMKVTKELKAVTDTTNRIIRENARNLRESTRAVVQEAERGIVEIDSLREANEQLIGTIQDVLHIQEEGRAKRKDAEGQLAQLEKDLHAALAQARATQM